MTIPKKIHYCWFGRGPLTDKQKMCIASWKGLLPDYEIVCWNEDNIPSNNFYLEAALNNKKWANVSNFIRLYALSNVGGIYLDTDIQLLRPLDDFLDLDCFFGFQYNPADNPKYTIEECINNAVIGSTSQHPIVCEALSDIQGYFDGSEPANQSSPRLISKLFIRHGLKGYSTEPINLGGATIFPKEYFYPFFYGQEFSLDCLTEETYALHLWDASWVDHKEELSVRDARIKNLSSELSVRDARIKDLKSELSVRDARIKDLNSRSAKQIAELESMLRKCRAAYQAVLSSTSWKITAPLRSVFHALQPKKP